MDKCKQSNMDNAIVTRQIMPLGLIYTGYVNFLEIPLLIAVALLACLFGVVALYDPHADSVVMMGVLASAGLMMQWMGFNTWKKLNHFFYKSETAAQLSSTNKTSEHAFLQARDSLLFWSLFVIVGAWFLRLPLPIFVIWMTKLVLVVCAYMCAREVCQCIGQMLARKYIDAELTVIQVREHLNLRVDIEIATEMRAAALTAIMEVIEIARDQDPEQGLLGNCIQNLSVTSSKLSDRCFRFEFHDVDHRILEMTGNASCWWRFQDFANGNYILLRLRVSSIKNNYFFNWR